MTDDEAALTEVRAACQAVTRARHDRDTARAARRQTFRDQWPTLHRFGHTYLVKQIGHPVTASAVKNYTSDLPQRPPHGPFVGAPPSPVEVTAVAAVNTACDRAAAAERAYEAALNQRRAVLRQHVGLIRRLGAARTARLIDSGLIGEATVRAAVADLLRAG